jgi:hypothetical protein
MDSTVGMIASMGHSWSEMDPAGAEAERRELDREIALRDAVGKLPLNILTVADLPAVLDMLGWGRGQYSSGPRASSVDRVERIVAAHGKRR